MVVISFCCTCSDVTDMFGKTPLDLAKQCFSTEVVEYLQSQLNRTTTPEPGRNTDSTSIQQASYVYQYIKIFVVRVCVTEWAWL